MRGSGAFIPHQSGFPVPPLYTFFGSDCFFSVLMDTATDGGGFEQLALFIRYLEGDQSFEQFSEFVDVGEDPRGERTIKDFVAVVYSTSHAIPP